MIPRPTLGLPFLALHSSLWKVPHVGSLVTWDMEYLFGARELLSGHVCTVSESILTHM